MKIILRRSAAVVMALIFVSSVMLSFSLVQKPWVVPAKYQTMKNPVASNATSIATGKELYTKHCKSCHGAKGLGDGPKSVNLKSKMRSFASKEFKAQKPGYIYYESFVGRDEMPNFEKKILEENERWSIVNYLLTL